MKTLSVVLGITVIASSSGISARDFFVSPQGSDSSPGTNDLPFRTIAHAQSQVRAWKQANGNENITVWLSDGQYRLSETLVFGLEDAATDGHRIAYSAIPGETPVISSDVSISGWKKLGQSPEGLPPGARGQVWVAPVPDSARDNTHAGAGAGVMFRERNEPATRELDFAEDYTVAYRKGTLLLPAVRMAAVLRDPTGQMHMVYRTANKHNSVQGENQ